ncbi:transcription factor MYB3R-1 [Mangifera indica]|uniref:transcription factor MYB3R-1 n=1 Tax=Mangifera indica TaxID=29780 RepID=UPI001CFAD09A|nr:transcription factor MYB3R-1 [Mangifera indica]
MESKRIISTPSDGLSDGGQRMRSLHGRTSGPTRRSTKGQWTPEEDEILRKAVQRFKGKNWKKIAECFKERTDVQCLHRWQKVLNPELVKGPWSKEEDEIIIELVNKFGPKKWSTIAQHLPGRIGKQCRERWHNHLNPSINKEAWTQEEELALIRAHQIYGNKWAELTKFLPGRTDNAIKNHWNSSVKKKLESYLASGLLEQFQGLPLVGHQNQPVPSSSLGMQSSGDDSCPKGGTAAEEISECSQDSNVLGLSHSTGNAVMHTREQLLETEESNPPKDHSSSPASCSEQYYTSLEDVTFSIPEIPCEVGCSSKFLEQNFVHDAGTFAGDYQFNLQDLPNVSSLGWGHQSLGLPANCMDSHESHEMVNVPYQNSTELSVPSSIGNLAAGSDKAEHILITDDECCRILFTEAMKDGCFSLENSAQGLNMVESSLCRSLGIQISEAGRTSPSQAYCPSKPEVLGTSCSQSFLSAPMVLSTDNGAFVYVGESSELNCHTYGTQDQGFITSGYDAFVYTNESSNSSSDDGKDVLGQQEPSHLSKDSLKLVPVNSFSLRSDAMIAYSSEDAKPNTQTEQQDAGSLCYEPPRFPSLDIPFFSCDLIQSGSDTQQEYSPLGIRQLMMSSMSCITPFRLWDSPSLDDSPEAVLKSAAKTFTGTPSILKKRHRELLSPLSDRRNDKKLEIDMTSSLARDFSRLDVMFDEAGGIHRASLLSPLSNQKRNSGAFIDEKENLGHAFDGGQEKEKDLSAVSHDRTSEKDCLCSNSHANETKDSVDIDSKTNANAVATTKTEKQPAGVLVEHNVNDLLFSPDQTGLKAERSLATAARTPRNQYFKSFGANQGAAPEQSPAIACSPAISKNNNGGNSSGIKTVRPIPSLAPPGSTVLNAGSDVGIDNYNIFGETPFKRSIESPSAWKSPWFMNAFMPGPRIDTDITIEDIGYFLSPGERSYDAIGLMKQLSEHTAAAYADALEVLGNETSEKTVNEGNSKKSSLDEENNGVTHSEHKSDHLASTILVERRTLDFSECGTPGKGKENRKSSTATDFSSPSSYLLKGCR